jgi:hypothetical protein
MGAIVNETDEHRGRVTVHLGTSGGHKRHLSLRSSPGPKSWPTRLDRILRWRTEHYVNAGSGLINMPSSSFSAAMVWLSKPCLAKYSELQCH